MNEFIYITEDQRIYLWQENVNVIIFGFTIYYD